MMKFMIKSSLYTLQGMKLHRMHYVEILKTENLFEKLLTYCQQNPPTIERLYTYLIKDYSNEVDEIFKVNSRMASNLANDRNKYKKVCSIIKTYKKACGLSSALPLIQELKERYIRRPAFVY